MVADRFGKRRCRKSGHDRTVNAVKSNNRACIRQGGEVELARKRRTVRSSNSYGSGDNYNEPYSSYRDDRSYDGNSGSYNEAYHNQSCDDYNEAYHDHSYDDYNEATRGDDYGPSQGGGSRSGRGGRGIGLSNILICAITLIAIFLIYTVVMGFSGPRKSECKELIMEIQESANELDVMGLVNCMSPDIRNSVTPYVIGAEIITGGKLQSVLRTIARGLGMLPEGNEDYEALFEGLQIKPVGYGFPYFTRKVRCKVTVMGIERNMVLTIKKMDGEAYLDRAVFA